VKTILGLAAILLFSPSFRALQERPVPELGSVQGMVTDARNGEGLYSIQVFIPDAKIGTLTNEDGGFLIQDVPLGEVTVRFQHNCYHPIAVKIQLTPGMAERSINVGLPYDIEMGYEKGCTRRIR